MSTSLYVNKDKSKERFPVLIYQIVLLNSTTRQNINLFLSRMEIGPEKLIESLEKGNPEVISLPTLQYLMKVLPDAEEVRTSSLLLSNGLVNGTVFTKEKIPR